MDARLYHAGAKSGLSATVFSKGHDRANGDADKAASRHRRHPLSVIGEGVVRIQFQGTREMFFSVVEVILLQQQEAHTLLGVRERRVELEGLLQLVLGVLVPPAGSLKVAHAGFRFGGGKRSGGPAGIASARSGDLRRAASLFA